MILVGVGTQLPFDRLIKVVDQWAFDAGRDDAIAQVGDTKYAPRALKTRPFIDPDEYRALQRQAQFTVSHAGTGSILTALEYGKPIVIMPRDARLGEHRNNHQMDTAHRFKNTPGVYVAFTAVELRTLLDRADTLAAAGAPVSSKASTMLTTRLRDFLR